MKIKFDWGKANQKVLKASRERADKATQYLIDELKSECPVGTVSHPMYKTGPFANQPWTMRDAGMLRRSIRKTVKYGDEMVASQNLMIGGYPYLGIRVYAGHYLAWYGRIVEFYTPWFRPTIARSQSEITRILENG